MTANDLRQMRLELMESQGEFAARFGVDRSTISRWETALPQSGPARALINRVMTEYQMRPKRGKVA
jgi:DNA-binding transcriptional regulator YiaG